MAELIEIRLLRPYRKYSAGTVIRATAGLAEHLVHNGTAVVERQGSLLPAMDRRTVEQAVAPPATAETR